MMGRRQHSLATCKWVDRDLLQREKFAGGRVFVNAFTSKEYYMNELELTMLRFYVVDFPPKKVAGKLFCFAVFKSFFYVFQFAWKCSVILISVCLSLFVTERNCLLMNVNNRTQCRELSVRMFNCGRRDVPSIQCLQWRSNWRSSRKSSLHSLCWQLGTSWTPLLLFVTALHRGCTIALFFLCLNRSVVHRSVWNILFNLKK